MSSQRQSTSADECWAGEGAGSQFTEFGTSGYARDPTPDSPAEIGLLARAIEREIIPRLLLSHRSGDAFRAEARPATGDEHSTSQHTVRDVEELVRIVLHQDFPSALAHVESLIGHGASVADILLDLLAPAARLLGEYWKNDDCDFMQVTLGLSHLQQILRRLRPEASQPAAPTPEDRRILLLPTPGEQHTFGICIVEEFLRRDGWDVWGGCALSRKKVVEIVRHQRFDILGLSLACEHFADEAAATIRSVRKASCNPYIAVMVGGPILIEYPDFRQRIGADASAADGREAVLCARTIGRASSPGRAAGKV